MMMPQLSKQYFLPSTFVCIDAFDLQLVDQPNGSRVLQCATSQKEFYIRGGSGLTWTSGSDEGEDLSTVSINLLPGT